MVAFAEGLEPIGGQSFAISALKWNQLLYDQAVAGGWAMSAMEPNGGASYAQSLERINLIYFLWP